MKIFGFEIQRIAKALAPVAENRGGWWPIIRESFAGAWQQNVEVDQNLVLSYHAVFACITLISQDIAKLRVKLVQQSSDGIWTEVKNSAYDPVLRKPNTLQNRIQFWENWFLSKLVRGNTYVLKRRDNRGVVNGLYILDPNLTRPLISDEGVVFYELNADNISSIREPIIVPAREIIHDRFNCLFHPLVGVSPIFANGLAATQGLRVQSSSAWFFGNKSNPGGVLTAPGPISQATADRLKAAWDANFTGENAGKIAVLGDGLKFERMAMTSVEAQLIEQLKWTAEVVCSTFHVPPYKIGIGAVPSVSNVQALNVEYYSQCLQSLIEAAELCLDEGLEMAAGMGTEFDIDGLLRMDTATQMDVLTKGSGIMKIDEMRKRLDLAPTVGGGSVYLQQQNFSLEALAKRDAQEDPFSAAKPPAPPEPEPAEPEPELNEQDFSSFLIKGAEEYASH